MSPRSLIACLTLGLGLLLAPTAISSAAALEWEVSPLYGGDVRSLAFVPGEPTTALAGTSSGQVFISRDGGQSWMPAGRPYPLPGWVVEELHFDRTRPGLLWAGLRGIWGGGAIVVSEDLGRTWELRSRRDEDSLYALETVPGEEGRLLIGTASGVWESSDGGRSWSHLTAGRPEIREVSSLLVDPYRPETIVAGTFRRAYRSDDAGRSWRGVFEGMFLDSQVFSLHTVPGRPGELWASTCGWVYRSRDRGQSWTRFKEGLGERRTPSFAVLPSGRLLAGTVSGVYVSDTGGRTWRRVTRPDLSILTIARSPGGAGLVLVGTEGSGVWRSTDGGSSFLPATRGMTSLRISALAERDGEMLLAVAHGGPVSGIYSTSDGVDFRHERSTLPTVLDLAFARGTAYAATEAGLFERAGGLWNRVEALGDRRVDEVVGDEIRALVRAGGDVHALTSRGLTAVRGGTEEGDLPALGADERLDSESDETRLVLGDRVVALGRLDLPIPVRDVRSVALLDGRVFLGTSGYGLISTPVNEVLAAADSAGRTARTSR